MERKIGEIFEIDGEWYQCVIGWHCGYCAFCNNNCEERERITLGNKLTKEETTGFCTPEFREDGKSVIFKKLEKVGEPIIYMSRTFQRLKSSDAEQCKYCYFGNQVCNPQLCGKESFLVEVKQNKEDMETTISNDATKHSNSENIGKNLKPFDLQAAKSGRPVCTRDGRKARIICFDRVTNSTNEYTGSLVVLITNPNGDEQSWYYTDKGILAGRDEYDNHKYDLMMLLEKKEGWVNLYRDEESKRVYCGEFIFSEREKAEKHYKCNDTKVATVSIGWEE